MDPKTMGDIVSAGMSNLDCIDAAGSAAFEAGINPTYATAVASADVVIGSTSVNQQLRDKTTDINAIARSGSIFSNFLGANANLRAQTQGAAQQAGSTAVAQSTSDDPLIGRFSQNQAKKKPDAKTKAADDKGLVPAAPPPPPANP